MPRAKSRWCSYTNLVRIRSTVRLRWREGLVRSTRSSHGWGCRCDCGAVSSQL